MAHVSCDRTEVVGCSLQNGPEHGELGSCPEAEARSHSLEV